MRISKSTDGRKTRIVAADEEQFDDMDLDEEVDAAKDDVDALTTLDELSDNLSELKDSLKEFEEDEVDIEMLNNITDHYIAECERCHNVFITAIEESSEEINDISGVCPVCDEESVQKLKWIIRNAKETFEE